MLFSVRQDPYPLFPRCHQDDRKMEDWGTGVRERGLNPTLSSQMRKLRQREVPRFAGHQVSQWPSRKQRALISSLSRFHSPILQPPDNGHFTVITSAFVSYLTPASGYSDCHHSIGWQGGLNSSSVLSPSLASGRPRSGAALGPSEAAPWPASVFPLRPPMVFPPYVSKPFRMD